MTPSSSSDLDADSGEDLETLRRVRSIAGLPTSDLDDDSESDGDSEDLDYLRSLQDRFSLPESVPPMIKPLSSIAPLSSSDDEDDLETLRAIQRRLNQYENDAMRENSDLPFQETKIAVADVLSVQESPDVLSKGSVCTAELPDPHSLELHQATRSSLSIDALVHSQFPKSVQKFVDALKKNRLCQRFIRRKLIEIEAKIEENKELKERIKCLMDFQLTCGRKARHIFWKKKDPRVRLISTQRCLKLHSTSKKIPALCSGPAENSHVSKYKMVMKKFPVFYSKQQWSNIEKEKLAKGLKQQYQEMLLLNTINFSSDQEGPIHMDFMTASDLEVTPEIIRSFFPLVNWDRLASMYLKGRSGTECESRWLNCEDPLINHSPWTMLEEKKLLFIVQERGIYDWIEIAIALGTQRTPFQCLARYQRSLNPHILKKDWTKDEDTMLRAAVESFGDNNWQTVASNLEGRTGPQCSNRWRKSLLPERRRVGKWSVDEDKQLKVAVMLFGAKNWNNIAQFVPGRTQVQCRERWLNCLDPSLNLQAWTREEDAKLLAAIDKHGFSWSRIATCVPPRTDSQCRRRWIVLRPHEVPLLQEARQLKRVVLISNFVDREIERPSIGLSDFSSIVNPPDSECERSKTISKKRPKDSQPKKSRAKLRGPAEETSTEFCTDGTTEISSSDLCIVPGAKNNTAETGSNKMSRKKSPSDNQPRKSRTKRRRLQETLTENGTECSLGDLCVVPGANVNTAETRSTKRSRKKASSDDQPRKRRAKCKRPPEETSTENGTESITQTECSLVDSSLVPDARSKKPRAKRRRPPQETLTDNGTESSLGDLSLPSAETGKTRRSRKKASSDGQPKKSRAKCRSSEGTPTENDTEGMAEIASTDLCLVPGANVNIGKTGSTRTLRRKISRVYLEKTKISDQEEVDAFAAEDVPLKNWVDALAYEARLKR